MVSFLRILHMYILITKLISLMIMFCACNDNQIEEESNNEKERTAGFLSIVKCRMNARFSTSSAKAFKKALEMRFTVV